jgi:hypothetical protein
VDAWLACTAYLQIKHAKMCQLILFLVFFNAGSFATASVKSTPPQVKQGITIYLKIDTVNWHWEILIENNIQNSYIKLYQPGLDYYRSPFKLYDSAQHEINSRCIIVDRFNQGKLYSKKTAKKMRISDTTTMMTKIVDAKKVSSPDYYSLDKYFCNIKKNNLIGFSYSTPVIIYNKQTDSVIGHINLVFSARKIPVSTARMLEDSASISFIGDH